MPFYRCELAANLTAESAMARIKAVVGPEPSFRRLFRRALGRDSAARPPFIGKVEGDSFRFRRDIWYRNDFRPIVTGRVTSAPPGVRVRVSMFLQPATAVFMFIWFAVVGLVAGLNALTFLRTSRAAQPGFLLPAAMLIFGVVLLGVGFFSEARQARRLLEQALGASSASGGPAV